MLKVNGVGPQPSKVMIVGEAPGFEEEQAGKPFIGMYGKELTRILQLGGVYRRDCYVTYVVKNRPKGNDIEQWLTSGKAKAKEKGLEYCINGMHFNDVVKEGLDELVGEIRKTKPACIIAVGGTALWALTGCTGVSKWRGSELRACQNKGPLDNRIDENIVVVPIYHPAAILRDWSLREITVHDVQVRVSRRGLSNWEVPKKDIVIAESYKDVQDFIAKVDTGSCVSIDIESYAGKIACVGLSSSSDRAVCIPLMNEDYCAYWGKEEEQRVIEAVNWVLRNCKVVGQNFNYDAQYFDRCLKARVYCEFDTMIAQAVMFPGTPKGLDYLASLYCEHYVYWKKDAKDWENVEINKDFWLYNAEDALRTFEVFEYQQRMLKARNLEEQFKFKMKESHVALDIMLRGFNSDKKLIKGMTDLLQEQMQQDEKTIEQLSEGRITNCRSNPQMIDYFYKYKGLKGIKNRKTKNLTCDDAALMKLSEKDAEIRDLCFAILNYRTRGSILSNHLGVVKKGKSSVQRAILDKDTGRLHFSANVVGTETFRWATSSSAFKNGVNVLNLTKRDQQFTKVELPNLRSLVRPEEGYTIAECDLQKADLQVVVWEAGDEELKQALREQVNVHAMNAKALFGIDAGPDGKKEPYYTFAKRGIHLTSYGGTPRVLAMSLGISVRESESFQRKWFEAHPGIKEWQKRVEQELKETKSVENIFKYRMIYFGRLDNLLKEALAWGPQSTVAIVTSKALVNIGTDEELNKLGVIPMLHGHDSVVFQYPTENEKEVLPRAHELLKIEVPYKDTLVIPFELQTSEISWGDCKEREWP